MYNEGLRYFVTSDLGDHIETFAKELYNFRKNINRDIIANFNHVYFNVTDKLSINDIICEYYNKLNHL